MENNFSSGWYMLGYLKAKYEHRLDEMARALNWPVTPDITFTIIECIVDDWFKRIATETQECIVDDWFKRIATETQKVSHDRS